MAAGSVRTRLLAAVLAASLCAATSAAAPSNGTQSLVRVAGQRFYTDGCQSFVPVGVNAFWMVEAAAEIPSGSFGMDWSGGVGRAAVAQVLDDLQLMGANFLRIWAFSVADAAPMQTSPGVYDTRLLNGLDWVVAEASRRGIRSSLVLTDWWKYAGGARQYLDWCGASDVSGPAFFTNRCAIDAYKANARFLIGRTNSFSGQAFATDPAIFSWEALNEPVVSGCLGCPGLLQRWLTEVAGAIAEADPTHLRTVGEEGFWSSAWRGSSFTGFDADPEPWAAHTGQDFSTQHALSTITYASTHLWPSNWAVVGGLGLLFPNSFSRNWIAAHIAASAALNKPLLLSEFGHYRDDSSASLLTRGSGNALQFMDSVWSAMEESVAAGRAGQGSALWSVYPECLRSASSADPYAIFTSDAEMMGRFRKHIVRMQTGAGKKVAGC